MKNQTRLAIISCKARKKSVRCTAEEMYDVSPQYKHQIEFIKSYYSDFKILSAKHGVLDRDQEIDPYDVALTKNSLHMPNETSVDRWATMVKKQIAQLSFQWDRIDLHLSSDYVVPIEQVMDIPNVYLIKMPRMIDIKQNYNKALELMEEKPDVNMEVISQYARWKTKYQNELLNKKIVLPWKL